MSRVELRQTMLRRAKADAWDEGVETALNFAKRNPDGVTLRLEKTNPYRKDQS